MNTIDVTVKIAVFAENEEEAIDIVTEILEGDSVIDSYHFQTEATV